MPGKVNPSIPEMVNQVCFQVMGCDATVALACEAGQLELNVMMPVIAWNALHASTILREAMSRPANAHDRRPRRPTPIARARAARSQHRRPRPRSVRTSATPRRRKSPRTRCKTGRPIRDLVLERGLLDAAQLDDILSVDAMTRGGIVGDATTATAGRSSRNRRDGPAPSARQRGRASSRRAARCVAHARASDAAARCRRTLPSRLPLTHRHQAQRPASTQPPPKDRLFPPPGSRTSRSARSRRTGRSPIRSWTRSASPMALSSPISAPAAAGSRSSWRGAWARTGSSTPRISRPLMIEAISRRVQNEGLDNVRTILGTSTDPRLPPGIDAMLIVDAYHEMDEPAGPRGDRRRSRERRRARSNRKGGSASSTFSREAAVRGRPRRSRQSRIR